MLCFYKRRVGAAVLWAVSALCTLHHSPSAWHHPTHHTPHAVCLLQPVDPRAVRARQAAFYAKHAKPPTPERPGNRRVTPQGYQRPPDGAGIVADRLLVRG